MSSLARIFSAPKRDRAAEAAAAAAKQREQERLEIQQAKEAAEAKKAGEIEFAQKASARRKLRRRGGAARTIINEGGALGISGGGQIQSKTLLGA